MVRYETAHRAVRLRFSEDLTESPSDAFPHTPATPKRTVRRKARRRYDNLILAVAALVAFVALGCTALPSWKTNSDLLADRSFSTVSVTVAPGDTLWSLAQRYEDPALRPAQRMDLIRQANPTIASALVPGQTLLVPVTDGDLAGNIHLARLPR